MRDVEGFVIAFGFAFHAPFGPKPVAWAELHASLDLLVGFGLPVVSGFETAGGNLHLGSFSLGVEAKLRFLALGEAVSVFAEVSGRIELLLFDLEATVSVRFGTSPDPGEVPAPAHSPVDRLGSNPDGTPPAPALGVALSETGSLCTGPEAPGFAGPAALEEIFTIFPKLRDRDHAPAAARPLATGGMGRKLAVRHAQNGRAPVA